MTQFKKGDWVSNNGEIFVIHHINAYDPDMIGIANFVETTSRDIKELELVEKPKDFIEVAPLMFYSSFHELFLIHGRTTYFLKLYLTVDNVKRLLRLYHKGILSLYYDKEMQEEYWDDKYYN